MWNGFIWLNKYPVLRPYEHVRGGSIKGGEFFNHENHHQFLKKDSAPLNYYFEDRA